MVRRVLVEAVSSVTLRLRAVVLLRADSVLLLLRVVRDGERVAAALDDNELSGCRRREVLFDSLLLLLLLLLVSLDDVLLEPSSIATRLLTVKTKQL